MKYLCVNLKGDLEIWETSRFGYPWICNNNLGSFLVFAGETGGPRYLGRDILEEWVE